MDVNAAERAPRERAERDDQAGAGCGRAAVRPAGPMLCVRPYCRNEDYWQVYFDSNRLIREAFGEAGFPAPLPAYAVTSAAGVAAAAIPR